MFDDAKKMMFAGLRAMSPGQDERQIKRLAFIRLYGADFPRPKLERILTAIFSP